LSYAFREKLYVNQYDFLNRATEIVFFRWHREEEYAKEIVSKKKLPKTTKTTIRKAVKVESKNNYINYSISSK